MTRATGGTGTRDAAWAGGDRPRSGERPTARFRRIGGRLTSGGKVAEVRALAGSPVASMGTAQAEGGNVSGGSGAAVACHRAVSGGTA